MIDSGNAVEGELSLHEINARIPRKVRPSDGNQTAIRVGLVILGVLLFLAWLYVHTKTQEARNRQTLIREGRETPATVTKVYHGRHANHIYYTFSFEGATYKGNASSDESVWDAQVGKYIEIQFLPADPSVNHPTPWIFWRLSDVVLIAVLLFCFGAAANATFVTLGERRLARIGWVTEGKVIACAPKGSRFRVDYEFFDEHHTLFDGANEYCDEYKTDSSIRVIYLRKNPKRNDAYPLADFLGIER